MLKHIFKKAQGPRFIDIYGWKWDGGLPELLRTPDMIFGASLAAIAATTDLLSGQGNAANTMLSGTMFCFMAKGVSFKITEAYLRRIRDADLRTAADYAIDTEGRTPPPENNDFLLRQCKILARWHIGGMAFFGFAMSMVSHADLTQVLADISRGAAPKGQDIVDSLVFVVPLMSSVDSYVRVRKLMRAEFTFCGKPPAVPGKAPAPAKAAATAVTPAARAMSVRNPAP